MSRSLDLDCLNEALRQGDVLRDANVIRIDLQPLQTTGLGADFFTAHLGYSVSEHRFPERLIVKIPLVGDGGRSEADAYQDILRGVKAVPTLRCYGAVDEGDSKPLALLFEDLTQSHWQTRWPIIPPFTQCQEAVGALAKIHACWWGSEALLKLSAPPVMAHQSTANLAKHFSSFMDLLGDYLPPSRRAIYERVFAELDGLVQRRMAVTNATLLHNDAHFWNFLYPNQSLSEQPHGNCVVLDWPLWRTGLGGCDLAYLIALHLYPEHRRRFEPALLARYHQQLVESGVASQRDAVDLDYRIGVVFQLLMPVMEFSWNNPPMSWLPKVEKGFAAFDDLNCSELLTAG